MLYIASNWPQLLYINGLNFKFETPCPTEYQQENSKLMDFDTDKKPFLVGADRFPIYKRDIVDVLPG